jgi:hypothetical protein
MPSNFLTKINKDGSRVWGTYLSGFTIRDIDFDKNSNSYSTGSAGLLLKLDATGNLGFLKMITDDYTNIIDSNSIVIDNDKLYLA